MYVEALIDCSKHLVEAGDNDDLDQPFAPFFPGVTNLPIFAAQAKGFFAKRGLESP